jgi:hypothetical protein
MTPTPSILPRIEAALREAGADDAYLAALLAAVFPAVLVELTGSPRRAWALLDRERGDTPPREAAPEAYSESRVACSSRSLIVAMRAGAR